MRRKPFPIPNFNDFLQKIENFALKLHPMNPVRVLLYYLGGKYEKFRISIKEFSIV
jgi:hypothetical protein